MADEGTQTAEQADAGAETTLSDRDVERRRLGRAIRAKRTERGLTLAEVAEDAGVSISLLSQVERGLIDPSLESLRNVAEALQTTPFSLLATEHSVTGIVRAGEGKRIALPDSAIEYELISPSLDGAFEIMRFEIVPRGVAGLRKRSHRGEEATLLLSGTVIVEIGDEQVRLDAGDCMTFDARTAHRTINIGDEPAIGLSIVSPPSF